MDLITEEDYNKYLETLNYMVVYPDKTIKSAIEFKEVPSRIRQVLS